ncbi:MAG: NAD(P)-dependent oxidoreductase [Salinarimonas sp.]|nr:NAD(P)-dependent oxidoreductase [Salinarimonas sp.]
MAILIIGGSGFIGLNLTEQLLAAGRDVTIFDRAAPPQAAQDAFAALPGRLVIETGEIGDTARLSACVARHTDGVIYGAAITAGPQREARDASMILAVNLGGLVACLEAAHEAGVRRVINLSSATAYGAAGTRHAHLIEDETPEDPRALYPITKFAGERFCARLAELWGADIRSVRLSGVFGPWEYDTGLRDTLSPQWQILKALEAGESAILPREGYRDWLYSRDAARAVIALLDAPDLAHQLYNIAPGAPSALLDWGRVAARAMDLPETRCRLAQTGETATIDLHMPRDRAPMDITRLAADTGFTPAFDDAGSVSDLMAWRENPGHAAL